MKVIAIGGWKENGKDTVANYLIKNHAATRISFADPLKDMVAKQYDIPRESLDDPKLKEAPLLYLPVNPQDGFSKNLCNFMRGEFRDQNGKRYGEGSPESVMYWTPRALAIMKGSSNRAVRSDFWVHNAVQQAMGIGGLIAISDLRFKTEMVQLKEAFGEDLVTIRVRRYETSTSTDPSERDLDDAEFDFYIDNTGTLNYTYGQIEAILERI